MPIWTRFYWCPIVHKYLLKKGFTFIRRLKVRQSLIVIDCNKSCMVFKLSLIQCVISEFQPHFFFLNLLIVLHSRNISLSFFSVFCLIFFPRDWAKERSRKFNRSDAYWILTIESTLPLEHKPLERKKEWCRFAIHFVIYFFFHSYSITFLLQSLKPAERFPHRRCQSIGTFIVCLARIRTRDYLTSARCTNHSKLSRTLFTIKMGCLIWYYRVLLLRQPPLLCLNPETLL